MLIGPCITAAINCVNVVLFPVRLAFTGKKALVVVEPGLEFVARGHNYPTKKALVLQYIYVYLKNYLFPFGRLDTHTHTHTHRPLPLPNDVLYI